MNKDVLAGAGLLVVSGLYYAATLQIQQSSLSDEIGPTGLPLILAGLLSGLSVLLMVRGWAMARADPFPAAVSVSDEDEPAAPVRRALGFLGLGLLYVVLSPIVGYVVALTMLIAAVAIYEGARPNWPLLAVALGGAGVFWLLFVGLLGVEQPHGLLF
jgi:putative tricarboxylic transport membrane protein